MAYKIDNFLIEAKHTGIPPPITQYISCLPSNLSEFDSKSNCPVEFDEAASKSPPKIEKDKKSKNLHKKLDQKKAVFLLK